MPFGGENDGGTFENCARSPGGSCAPHAGKAGRSGHRRAATCKTSHRDPLAKGKDYRGTHAVY
eukprot:694336-Pyramimonas_sp.AAC.1